MSHFSDPRIEWRINDIESSLRGKADSHEMHSLRSSVDSLERTVREACADIAWLRGELQAAQDQITRMQEEKDLQP